MLYQSLIACSLIFSLINSLNWVITFHDLTYGTNNYHMTSLYTIIYTCMLKLYIFYHTVSKLNIGKELNYLKYFPQQSGGTDEK